MENIFIASVTELKLSEKVVILNRKYKNIIQSLQAPVVLNISRGYVPSIFYSATLADFHLLPTMQFWIVVVKFFDTSEYVLFIFCSSAQVFIADFFKMSVKSYELYCVLWFSCFPKGFPGSIIHHTTLLPLSP